MKQPFKSPIYDGRQQFTAAGKPLRVSIDSLRSPTAGVIESALLMLLIGWIDYKTTDFAITLLYFAPVVLAYLARGTQSGLVYRGTLRSDGAHGGLDGAPQRTRHCARLY
ncbi:MAG: hypothetical protein ACJ8KF_14185 [Chthoniobacterales bacterium]